MRCLNQAVLYPGVGSLETTNLSVGRGTDTPFEVVGAPWIDGRRLAAALNGAAMPGVRFVPIRFTPTTIRFANEPCQGVHIVITDRAQFASVPTGLEIAVQLRRLFPDKWEMKHYNRLLASRDVFKAIQNGESTNAIVNSFQDALSQFAVRRARYLLYD